MTGAERKFIQQQIKRAKEQRNATTNDEDFDLWHGILEEWQGKLKEDNK